MSAPGTIEMTIRVKNKDVVDGVLAPSAEEIREARQVALNLVRLCYRMVWTAKPQHQEAAKAVLRIAKGLSHKLESWRGNG